MVPEYTRKKASLPTNGSAIILNANAENGSSSEECLSISLPSKSVPLIDAISVGAGIYSKRTGLAAFVLGVGAAQRKSSYDRDHDAALLSAGHGAGEDMGGLSL